MLQPNLKGTLMPLLDICHHIKGHCRRRHLIGVGTGKRRWYSNIWKCRRRMGKWMWQGDKDITLVKASQATTEEWWMFWWCINLLAPQQKKKPTTNWYKSQNLLVFEGEWNTSSVKWLWQLSMLTCQYFKNMTFHFVTHSWLHAHKHANRISLFPCTAEK